MKLRIGTVTNLYPVTGKVKVVYNDEKNASLPLAMLTMNREVSLPAVGDKVVTIHMENGSSKGFVLGTYYGGGMQPKANMGYRKDFDGIAFATSIDGTYTLMTNSVKLHSKDASLVLDENAAMLGKEVRINATNLLVEAEDISLNCKYGTITVEDMMKRIERIEEQLGLPHTI